MKETGRPSTLPEESVHENLNFAISLTANSLNFKSAYYILKIFQ